MQTLFQKMRANRCRWIKPPIQAAEVQPAPEVPFMVVDGERYVEAPEVKGCTGCEFFTEHDDACFDAANAGALAFSGRCSERRVIYIKAE
jgi:hypothetical protein